MAALFNMGAGYMYTSTLKKSTSPAFARLLTTFLSAADNYTHAEKMNCCIYIHTYKSIFVSKYDDIFVSTALQTLELLRVDGCGYIHSVLSATIAAYRRPAARVAGLR